MVIIAGQVIVQFPHQHGHKSFVKQEFHAQVVILKVVKNVQKLLVKRDDYLKMVLTIKPMKPTEERSLWELESRIMATSLRRAPHLRIFERLQASVDKVNMILMQCRLSLSLSGFAMLTAMSISQAATMASAVLSM